MLIDREESSQVPAVDIDGAKESVHLLYYIFALDSMTERLSPPLKGRRPGWSAGSLVDALGPSSFLKKDASASGLPASGWRRPLPGGTAPQYGHHGPVHDLEETEDSPSSTAASVYGIPQRHGAFHGGKAEDGCKGSVLQAHGPVVLQLQGSSWRTGTWRPGNFFPRSGASPGLEAHGTAILQTVLRTVLPLQNWAFSASWWQPSTGQKRVVITTPLPHPRRMSCSTPWKRLPLRCQGSACHTGAE